MKRGCFITFEGVEGCGKSTQLALLKDYLESRGCSVDVTREPGGTPIAEAIRGVLLDPVHREMTSVTELLLYAAARAQHVAERIRPALDAGKVVLCDRFADSTTAYQGAGRALSPETIAALHRIATGGVWPDLTIVLDIDPEEGLKRAMARRGLDRIENESIEFHRRVREGFLALSRSEPERVVPIDGARGVDAVAADVRRLAEERIPLA
ncbi:MAG: dTMP kinase [Candidatus Hydrogenedentes bacterium]|nr:dTMP kinase [Candidatus Hydrogenedentota bacterium]